MCASATSTEPRRETGARSRGNPMCTHEYVEGPPERTLCKQVRRLRGARGYVVRLLKPTDSLAYVFFRIQSFYESRPHRDLFIRFTWIRTQWMIRSPGFSSCSAWHAARSCRETIVESWLLEHLKHHEEDTMSHRRKKFLSAGLAGVLCSTALFGLTAAHTDGKNNLHLPGMRDRPHAPVIRTITLSWETAGTMNT